MLAGMKTRATSLYPFAPSGSDFAHALAFFAELGFTAEWNSDGYAGLRFGGAHFILQQHDGAQWAQNQMIVYEVDDLDAYWSELEAKALPERFAGVKVKAPTDYPWGRELHIIDPAGVCWHVRQAGPA
jgi:hypothetical protein